MSPPQLPQRLRLSASWPIGQDPKATQLEASSSDLLLLIVREDGILRGLSTKLLHNIIIKMQSPPHHHQQDGGRGSFPCCCSSWGELENCLPKRDKLPNPHVFNQMEQHAHVNTSDMLWQSMATKHGINYPSGRCGSHIFSNNPPTSPSTDGEKK